MEIKKKIVKEVEETIGYKCDICGEEICVNFPRLDLSTGQLPPFIETEACKSLS